MKRLLILLIVLGPLSSFACSCHPSPLTAVNLKSQDYVALVRIKEQLPFDEEKYRNRDPNIPVQYEVLVDEIVRFKGASIQKITVFGAPPDSKTIRTSCDIEVSPGQEWLVISNLGSGGSVSIGMCGNNILYRDKDGFRNWQFSLAIKKLLFINEVLPNAQLASVINLEKPVSHYPNGQIERTISYRNKKKNGTALYYYPNGTIYGRVDYKKDSLNRQSIWYDKQGQIQSKATYRMGIPVDSMIYYMYPNAPMYVSIRSKKGIIQKFQEYDHDSTKRKSSYLYSETLYAQGKKTSQCYYRQDGTVRFIVKHHSLGTTELTYDESGALIKTREFDNKGKLY